MEQTAAQPRMMVAVQVSTDEGAFICNLRESDLPTIEAGEGGALIVMHCAIRLDGMIEGRYELYETKVIETSSIDCYQSLEGRVRHIIRKGQPALLAKRGR